MIARRPGILAALAFSLAVPAHAATLVYTNDVLGDIEPCGCRGNPQGGLIRKAVLLEKLDGTSASQTVLQVDAGDTLFETQDVPPLLTAQAELRAKSMVEALGAIHQDVLVPGEKDFALGLDKFLELTRKSRIRILAANLLRKNGKTLFPGHVLLTLKQRTSKPLKIAVIGLLGEKLRGWPADVRITPAVEAAKREVQKVRAQADLVIAVTHQGYDADVALAKAVRGIDIIAGGHTQSFLQTPVLIGKTWIVQSSFRNQYVGVFPLQVPIDAEKHQLVGLDAGYEPKGKTSGLVARVQEVTAEFKVAMTELNNKTDPASCPSTVENKTKASLQGFNRCAECHWKQFDFWRKTAHARAEALGAEIEDSPVDAADYQKFLKEMSSAKTLDSEVTVPKTAKSPKRDLKLKDAVRLFSRVSGLAQCESCHAPGGDHPFSGGYSKKVPVENCLKCHSPKTDSQWYTEAGTPNPAVLNEKIRQVTCPAGDLGDHGP